MKMDLDLRLIRKYNAQGPRYTSYPTAVQFHQAGKRDLDELNCYLRERNRQPRSISLYIHIPFCFSLCWYCGCTKVITKDRDRGDGYLDYLEREMDLIAGMLHPESEVIQVHFGGGTPTFLTPEQLSRLGSAIERRFTLSNEVEFGVEIDPRRCTHIHISTLKEIGCNRASLGIQDTNPEVQRAVHRIQPFEQVRKVTGWLRNEGIDSVNFDLIYGLPKQTPDSFGNTLDEILQLQPDRLALYSYAHLPERMPAQRLLDTGEMPSTDEKLEMFRLGISYLTRNGYRFIGLDHFSREGEELTKAMDEGTLQRNFQGYSTHSGADLYGFGMSGISNVGKYYWQNSKRLEHYYASLDDSCPGTSGFSVADGCSDKGGPPAEKILHLCRDDRIRKDAIMRIMCGGRLSFNALEQKWGIVFEEYFRNSLRRLAGLASDNLVEIHSNGIKVTGQGRLFLRNIAICFDRYLRKPADGFIYSKTV